LWLREIARNSDNIDYDEMINAHDGSKEGTRTFKPPSKICWLKSIARMRHARWVKEPNITPVNRVQIAHISRKRR